ncbi:MAG: hypothetical protein QXM12_00580 [Nitrososphaerota archaeon]
MLSLKFTKSDVSSTLFRWQGSDKVLEISSELDDLLIRVSSPSGNILEEGRVPYNDTYALREIKLFPDGRITLEGQLIYAVLNSLPSGGSISVGHDWRGGVREVSSTFTGVSLDALETLSDQFEILTANWGTFYQVPLVDPAPGPILSHINSELPPADLQTAYGKVWLGVLSKDKGRVHVRLYYLTDGSGAQISVGSQGPISPQMRLFAAWPLNSNKSVRDFSTDFTAYGEPRMVVVYGDGTLVSYSISGYSRIYRDNYYLRSVKSAKLFPSALLYGTVPSDLYLFTLDTDNRLWSYNLSTLSSPEYTDLKNAISEQGTRFLGSDVRLEVVAPLSSSDELLELVFHSIDYPNRRLYVSLIYSPSDIWYWMDDIAATGPIWRDDEESADNPVWRV